MADISLWQALALGVVEGLTEFLPISSTGHLILTAHWLGLSGNEGVKAFQIVIQSGALLAVAGLYRARLGALARGLAGRDQAGLALLVNLAAAFLPAAILGIAAGDWIKARLFGPGPVAAALAVGGAAMIAVEWHRARRTAPGREAELEAMRWRAALVIGLAQCLALWPGMSRSMVTIVAALLLGFSPRAAAEFSFLLALPTLGGATAYDALQHGRALVQAAGPAGLTIGFVASAVVAWLAIEGLLAWLRRRGLAVFGWYRLALALVVLLIEPR